VSKFQGGESAVGYPKSTYFTLRIFANCIPLSLWCRVP